MAHHDHHGHDHDHDHGHHHVPDVTPKNEKVILVAFVITFTFMFVEAVGGVISGSLALIADAGHMMTDAAALALAWAAFRFGRRKRDDRRSFGYMRFEILAGFVNALMLILLVMWIAYEVVMRILDPTPILAGPMLIIACLGLVVNATVLWMLMQGDRDHVNIRGAMLHVLGDFLSSVAAISAAIAIYFTGWTPIDPMLSLLVSAVVLRSALILLKSTLHILMEGTPTGVVISEMRETLSNEVDGVIDLHHVHVWSITSGKPSATMEVQVADDADPAKVVRAIKARLASAYGIAHSTIEIDWEHERRNCVLGTDGRTGSHQHDHGHWHEHREKQHHDHLPSRRICPG
ncbi:cation diffusion facilitator family transporter [Natronohydrobacter thiooxidans]|uniref:cation diffusion facilitator family transporter n=1 Tax=Natronohydrobacter thiooxidans TaxID=87172 RepID=UPI0008FF5817|nr:cation diffusion facilitator family transporter [Natronohydrobacter thiooxidans]